MDDIKKQIRQRLHQRYKSNDFYTKHTEFDFKVEDGKMLCNIICGTCKETIKLSTNPGWGLNNYYRHINQKHPSEEPTAERKVSSTSIMKNWIVRSKTSDTTSQSEPSTLDSVPDKDKFDNLVEEVFKFCDDDDIDAGNVDVNDKGDE